MAVSHNPAGFAGTVDEIAEARRFGLAAPPFRVASVNDWAPSADAVVNRQVNISAGQGAAYGVADITTTPDSVTLAPNGGSNNRFDAVVATFAWAANSGAGLTGHTVTFRVIPGTTAPPQVNSTTTLDNAKMNRVKGIQYDALIAIVRIRPSVGLLTSGDVVDCRLWGGFGGYINTGSGTYLASMDTQPGALVHATDTDIVWNRLAGGTWGFEKWIGSDRTKQPMISVRNTTLSIAQGVGTLAPWTEVTDHGGGLLSVSGSNITCNVAGRVRIETAFLSDLDSAGYSWVAVLLPAGGGNYLGTTDDLNQRSTGYSGAGRLRQSPGAGPVQVQPGDVINAIIFQLNTAASNVAYQAFLTVTYV